MDSEDVTIEDDFEDGSDEADFDYANNTLMHLNSRKKNKYNMQFNHFKAFN